MSGPRVVYEVTLSVPEARAEELADWLPWHASEMLALPGFIDANIFDPEPDEQTGRMRCEVQYVVSDRKSLDEYLEQKADEMRREGIERFGDDLSATRRILPIAEATREIAKPRCANCDAPLTGQYCWNCGQRAQSRLISLWELVRDGLGDVLDVDSRFWRTLIALLFRPGYLTHDYLQGRRAKYMPPFRTYLVMSALFFVVALFDSEDPFWTMLLAPEPSTGITSEPPAPDAEASADSETLAQAIDDVRSAAETARAVDAADPGQVEAARERLDETVRRAEEAARNAGVDDASFQIRLGPDDEGSAANCEIGLNNLGWEWLNRRLTEEREAKICERITADRGQGLLARILDQAPIGLIVLLPVIAFVLMILYPLSRRYYVEHLLLLIHYHAFIFLALTLVILINRLVAALGLAPTPVVFFNIGIAIYIFVYLFRALRRVYGQGFWVTSVKFTALIALYFAGASVISAFVVLYAALTL
jgi:hypothetical protein